MNWPTDTPRHRYQNDPSFRMVVESMLAAIHQCQLTPAEMREAAVLASIMYAERFPQRIVITAELEKALTVIEHFKNQPESPQENPK